MRRLSLSLLLLVLFVPAAHPASKAGSSSSAKKSASDWPDTPAGATARDFVTAFNQGDDAMKAFYLGHFEAESLAARPGEKRLARYHDLRGQVGSLGFAGVVEDSTSRIVVRLVDADGAPHEFTFVLEAAPPHHLRQVFLKQSVMHPGFGGFHH